MSPQIRRNFIIGVVHEAVWGLAFGLINPATILPLALGKLGGGPAQTGWMAGLMFGGINLPQFFSAFLFSPRWTEPKWCAWMHAPALACTAGSAALFYFFPGMMLHTKMLAFMALSIAHWFFIGFVVPHWVGMHGRCIPDKIRGRFFGLCFSLAALLGAGSGIYSARFASEGGLQWGFAACFGLAFLLQAFSAASLALLKPLTAPPSSHETLGGFLRNHWNGLFSQQAFRVFLWLNVLMQLSSAVGTHFTTALKQRGVGDSWFQLYNPAVSLGGMIGSYALGQLVDLKGPRAASLWAFAFMGLALLFMAPGLHPSAHAVGYFGNGFFGGIFGTVNLFLILRFAGGENSTGAMGLFATLCSPLVFAMPPLLGWLAEAWSYEAAFAFSGLSVAVSLAVLLKLKDFGGKIAVAA